MRFSSGWCLDPRDSACGVILFCWFATACSGHPPGMWTIDAGIDGTVDASRTDARGPDASDAAGPQCLVDLD